MGVTGIINEQNNNLKANFDDKFVNRKMCQLQVEKKYFRK
jgi:hypothetical protein